MLWRSRRDHDPPTVRHPVSGARGGRRPRPRRPAQAPAAPRRRPAALREGLDLDQAVLRLHIRPGLLALVTELGEDPSYLGRRERQVGPAEFYNSGGEAFPVTDLTSALRALRVITEQGEGLSDSPPDAPPTGPEVAVR
ncbi:MAG: ferritin-like domain-containing protein [Pseudonocardiaceae bacterium]